VAVTAADAVVDDADATTVDLGNPAAEAIWVVA
jgi:DtxR family Mn-dependent transcriptional regulator